MRKPLELPDELYSIAEDILGDRCDLRRAIEQILSLRSTHELFELDEINFFVLLDSELDPIPRPEQQELWDPVSYEEKQAIARAFIAEQRTAIIEACRKLLALRSAPK